MTYEEQVDLVRNLKGAAASIILILALSGRSLTGDELCVATGYSDKPVKQALAWLEPRGFVQNNGRQHGWSLGSAVAQLPLPLALDGGQDGFLPVDKSDEAVDNSTPDSAEIGNIPISEGEGDITRSENFRSSPPAEDTEIGNSPNYNPEQRSRDRKYSDLGDSPPKLSTGFPQLDRKFSDLAPEFRVTSRARASDHDLIRSDDLIDDDQSINQSETRAREVPDRKFSEVQFHELLDAVGIEGPARSRVLGRDSPALVAAWWWWTSMRGWVASPSGWIIRCLENGDRPPSAWIELAEWYLSASAEALAELESTAWTLEMDSFLSGRGLSEAAVAVANQVHQHNKFWRSYEHKNGS